MKPKNLQIKFVREQAYNLVKGKRTEAIDEKNGEIIYARNDCAGLQHLLQRFDTKKNTVKAWKMWNKVGDKLSHCYVYDKKAMDLSLDEFVFLRDFLNDLMDKNNKDTKDVKDAEKETFQKFEIKTLIGITEQMAELDK